MIGRSQVDCHQAEFPSSASFPQGSWLGPCQTARMSHLRRWCLQWLCASAVLQLCVAPHRQCSRSRRSATTSGALRPASPGPLRLHPWQIPLPPPPPPPPPRPPLPAGHLPRQLPPPPSSSAGPRSHTVGGPTSACRTRVWLLRPTCCVGTVAPDFRDSQLLLQAAHSYCYPRFACRPWSRGARAAGAHLALIGPRWPLVTCTRHRSTLWTRPQLPIANAHSTLPPAVAVRRVLGSGIRTSRRVR